MRSRHRLLPEPLHREDLRLFRRVARSRVPVLDRTLPPLTRAADHSLLWAAIAAVLAAIGGRFGRRAALRGMAALAATSFATNVPAKYLLRRERPPMAGVPKQRRILRIPSSTSFPSGHSASAFAFATGVALEKPSIGIPLLGMATAVAYSRVYVGVHYPSDVIAGAAIGTSLAFATRHLWPVAPDAPARARPASVPLSEVPSTDGTGLSIVVNATAGGGSGPSAKDLQEAFPGAGIIEIGDQLTVDEALGKATAAGCAIGVCGGDGTVNAAARAALGADKPLVVIPGGTLNHFARDIGVESIDDVKDALEAGHAVGVDVGIIAGRPFLNTASFGGYADLVDARERLEHRIGKWPALVVALAHVLRHGTPVDVELDGRRARVWMSFIGNCRYEPAGFAPSWRSRLDDEALDVRLVEDTHPFARFRLVWAVLTGTLSRTKVYSCDVKEGPVRIRVHGAGLRLACDGETFDAPDAEFTIEKAPERLTVFVPHARAGEGT